MLVRVRHIVVLENNVEGIERFRSPVVALLFKLCLPYIRRSNNVAPERRDVSCRLEVVIMMVERASMSLYTSCPRCTAQVVRNEWRRLSF